jgi:hypothetical protein
MSMLLSLRGSIDGPSICQIKSEYFRIIERVVARLRPSDPLDSLRLIGVDELSCRRHHEHVTVVVDHERGAVV